MRYNLIYKFFFLLAINFIFTLGNINRDFCNAEAKQTNKSKDIKLVLLLVIDQFAYNYIERLTPSLKGGLKYIISNGASVTQAFHPFANTETCPGHATIASGYYPSNSGIIANNWYNTKKRREEYCVSDSKHTTSPKNNLKSSLGDWLKAKNDKSLVFTVSGKDRAAVMLGGKKADGAYWYEKTTGRMVSSSYYPLNKTAWLDEFNKRKIPNLLFGQTWSPLKVSDEEYRFARIEQLSDGDFNFSFPHPIGSFSTYPDPSFYSAIFETPFLDELTVLLAQEILDKTKLGKDSTPDLLGVSLSAVDLVGHRYGPNSKEIYDTFKRLDISLESLLTKVEEEVGLKNTLIVLTGDHGVLPMPEYSKKYGSNDRRVTAEDISCLQKRSREITEQLKIDNLFLSPLYFNPSLNGLPNGEGSKIIEQFAVYLKACNFIEEAWTEKNLFTPLKKPNPFQILFQRSYFKGRSPDIMIQPKEGLLMVPQRGTTHGTPYTYDAHVPLFFVGANINKGTIDKSLEITALAPTVAKLINVKTPKDLDISRADRDELLLNLVGKVLQ
jgi:predicted AlkP superfamily pyrophosphatase or phosphodiesterase